MRAEILSRQRRRENKGSEVMREKRREIKLPVDAFTSCPSCCSANYLHQMSIDVYCHGCGWDSSSVFVDVGGLDELIYEYEMKLQRQAEQAVAVQRRIEEKKQNMRRAV